jgi:hypothetical protein
MQFAHLIRGRRARARTGVAALLGLATMAATPLVAAASSTTLTAPYAAADHQAYCYAGSGTAGTCSATADGNASTGRMQYDLSATSPAAGASDNGNSHGDADVRADYALVTPTASVTVTVAVHITSAAVSFSGSAGAGTFAEGHLNIIINDTSCTGGQCWANSSPPVVSARDGGSQSVSGTDLTYTYRLSNYSGALLPVGTIQTSVGIAGSAGLAQGNQGTVSSSMDATLTSVTLDTPPLIGSASGQYAGGLGGVPDTVTTAPLLACPQAVSAPAGMVCLSLPATTASVGVGVSDTVTGVAAARWAFWGRGAELASGTFCGGGAVVTVPAGADSLGVYPITASAGGGPCRSAAPAVAGTVTGYFYG